MQSPKKVIQAGYDFLQSWASASENQDTKMILLFNALKEYNSVRYIEAFVNGVDELKARVAAGKQ